MQACAALAIRGSNRGVFVFKQSRGQLSVIQLCRHVQGRAAPMFSYSRIGVALQKQHSHLYEEEDTCSEVRVSFRSNTTTYMRRRIHAQRYVSASEATQPPGWQLVPRLNAT